MEYYRHVSPSYKNTYLKQNPNINKIIEETKNILNNKQPIKQEFQNPTDLAIDSKTLLLNEFQKPKTLN